MEINNMKTAVQQEWQKLKQLYSDQSLAINADSYHSWEKNDAASVAQQEDYFQRSHYRFALLAKLICDNLPQGSCVLDAGAGNGLLASTLHSLGYKAYATELYEKMPVLDRISVPYQRWHLEAEAAPFEDNSMDAVVLSQTIEHFTFGPKKTLDELLRILKPGGLMLIDVPNISSFRNVSKLIRGKSIMWDLHKHYLIQEPAICNGIPYYDRHNHEYCMQDLQQISEYFNLEIISSAYYSSSDVRRGKLALLAAQLRDLVPHYRHYVYALYRKPADR